MGIWDETAVLWLNKLLALSPELFALALWLTDRLQWVLVAVILVVLWYTDAPSGNAIADTDRSLESRRKVLIIFLAGALAFVVARGTSLFIFRERPLSALPIISPLPNNTWQQVVQQLGNTNSFPGDITAIWFAVTGGVFLYNRRASLALAIMGIFFSLLRVSLGFFYPTDIIAGACLGILILSFVNWLRPRLMWFINPTLTIFSRYPGVAYPLALLLLLDATQQMAGLIGLLVVILGI